MEPTEIDWKNTISQFERDDVYERINAPKWIDLSAPDAAVDDAAWFCRPDCRHPIIAEDFKPLTTIPKVKLVSSNSMLTVTVDHSNDNRDASLKRRAGISTLYSSSVKPNLNSKKFSEDLENQNPNTEATPPALKGKKLAIAKKEAIKSSAEKKWGGALEEGRREAQSKLSQPDQPKLKNTFSARNLFSGRDIMSQISDFCNELKKLATGKESRASDGEKMMVIEQEKEKASGRDTINRKSNSLMKKCELAVRLENSEEKRKILREARAFPPTPQRFPSPSSHRLLQGSKASTIYNSSLGKLPKSKTPERGAAQEHHDQSREEKRQLIPRNEECNGDSIACEAEGSPVDMFWFLKPCTYLV